VSRSSDRSAVSVSVSVHASITFERNDNVYVTCDDQSHWPRFKIIGGKMLQGDFNIVNRQRAASGGDAANGRRDIE